MPRTAISLTDLITSTNGSSNGSDDHSLEAAAGEILDAVVQENTGTEAVTHSPTETEQIVLDAMLDEFARLEDPYAYLDRITETDIPLAYRHQYYQRFVEMIAQRSHAEQDALIRAGQRVFQYRTDTAHADVKRLRGQAGPSTRVEPCVTDDEFIAEIVYDHSAHALKYMMYRYADESTEVVESIQVGSSMYTPPQTSLVDGNTIHLPTGIEEYGDFGTLFRDIRHFIRSYVFVEDRRFLNLMTYYVMLTWIYDRFDAVPYIRWQGAFQSGKTRALQVIGSISFRSIAAAGATTSAPIFRLAERFKGTLMIDEADFSQHSELWQDLVKLLNVGYMRGFSVLRTERNREDNFDVKGYQCFGPKMLSTRRRFSDEALESRCLSYTMPLLPTVPDHIPLTLGDEFRAHAQTLRNKLLLWRLRRWRHISLDPRQRFHGLSLRLNQILLPIMACAENETMRQNILERAREYEKSLQQDRRESYEGQVALALLQRYKNARPRGGTVQLKEVVEVLKAEHGEGIKITSRSLSSLVHHTFGLDTVYRGGLAWAQVDDAKATRIGERYAIPRVIWDTSTIASPNGGRAGVTHADAPETIRHVHVARLPVLAVEEPDEDETISESSGETSDED